SITDEIRTAVATSPLVTYREEELRFWLVNEPEYDYQNGHRVQLFGDNPPHIHCGSGNPFVVNYPIADIQCNADGGIPVFCRLWQSIAKHGKNISVAAE